MLLHVAAQSLLQRRYAGSGRNVRGALADAGFGKELIEKNVEQARRAWSRGLAPPRDADRVGRLRPDALLRRRRACGEGRLRPRAPPRPGAGALAWDLGCNTGTFARLVEPQADQVVAMDADWMAIERLYQRAARRRRRAASCRWSSTSPTPRPSQGWRGAERKDLASRGAPDLVLCLALVHHVVITANIPLADFLDWLASLGAAVVIEFVGRDDEMVQALLANREDQYDDYTRRPSAPCCRSSSASATRRRSRAASAPIFFAEPARR